VKKILNNYKSELHYLNLPSAPIKSIMVVEEKDMPQPLKHKEFPKMVTLVGRIRKNEIFRKGIYYILTSDNLEKGAGGGAVLTAEYLFRKQLL
jgi:aspartate-semialdehyde dehydrogenase